MNLLKIIAVLALLAGFLSTVDSALADRPETVDGVTRIHLDQYNGYFAAQETVTGLKAGTYEFVVANKAGKLVGFQIQNLATREDLDVFPLQPGETQVARVEVTTDGVRFRCPINPTPWYELDTVAPAQ